MKHHPIPDDALDDRHAFVGTSGSGKTYNAGTAVERVLALEARVGIVDPLGGWWGLRLLADGKTPSPYSVVIFGGPHADLPLTENAGQLIGETCAGMAESFILDLSELGTKAAERRFMLGFLQALYRKTDGDPLHLIVDEADMFAPQMVSDKDGEAVKLLGMMETIVRRGRIKGFIPWLITQRPAVLNKNVLSQADGLIAMKLTSSQDRAALGDWIEGQADRVEGKRILGEMPTLQLGQGVVWIPGRGILTTANFPKKLTFDSSRTPKRGETKRAVALKPLDVGALSERLATIETEVAANDPVKLRAEIAALQRAAGKPAAPAPPQPPSPAALAEAEARGFARGHVVGRAVALKELAGDTLIELRDIAFQIEARAMAAEVELGKATPAPPRTAAPPAPAPRPAARVAAAHVTNGSGGGDVSSGQGGVLASLAWWRAVGFDRPTRIQVAAVASLAPQGSTLRARLSELQRNGLVTYPDTGHVELTQAGVRAAPPPPSGNLRQLIVGQLSQAQLSIFETLLSEGRTLQRDELAVKVCMEPAGSTLRARLSELHRLELIGYPRSGQVEIRGWVREALLLEAA